MSRPFRYTFILGLVAFATGLAAFGGWRYARASAPVNGPIILISIDALRADRLPAYGYRGVSTPSIDALAADGVVFDRAYSHTPQTLPAHAALFSGRLPPRTGVRDETHVVGERERLIAEMLRDRGYATGAVVSSYALRGQTGINQGFTLFDDDLTGDPESLATGLWRSGELSEEIAEEWLSKVGTSRVFLFLHLYEPHTARLARPAPPDGSSAYDAEVARADSIVGRLIRYLKSHQLYDRSTIILVSDHGEGLGDHGEQEHGLFVYEEALRVPLIVKQAAAEGAGRRVKEPVQHVDLVPTLLDLAKAPDPGGLEGRSLKPMLEGADRRPSRRVIYSESLYGRYQFGWHGLATLTDGKFRYIKAPREELYDLEADPAEQENLAATDAKLTAWRELLAEVEAGAPAPAAGVSPSDTNVREKLAALGHVAWHLAAPVEDEGASPDPKDTIGLLETRRAASKLTTARRWPEAISLVQSALRKQPRAVDLWFELASLCEHMGRDEQALAAYRRLIALLPQDERPRLDAASVLFRLRRFDEARQHATALAEADSTSPEDRASARALLAEIALARGDADRARLEALEVRRLDAVLPFPDYVEARLFYDQGRFADALPLFEKVIGGLAEAGHRPLADLHYFAGHAAAELALGDEAVKYYQAELSAFPRHVRSRAALAAIYYRNGQQDEAVAAVSAITAVSPTPDAYKAAARLWESFGETRKAAETRAEARRLSSEKAAASLQTTRR